MTEAREGDVAPAEAPLPLALRHWRTILAIWLLAAAAWTPAALLSGQVTDRSPLAIAGAFALMVAHFAPWALATPLFLALGQRFPIGLGRTARNILLFALLGLVLIPLFTVISVTLSRITMIAFFDFAAGRAFANFGAAILITSLFAVPTYAAVVGIGQIVAYLERYRARERLLSRARAETLRAQIAPHFLFNALNAVSALGYRDPALADRALVRLAGLLRQTLERPDWTTVRDEVALIADYVELHRLLLGDRLEFSLDIAPGAWEARLPSMLLQPLVENALVHGVSRLAEGGAIRLVATRAGDRLDIEIANDAPAASATPGTGLGLANVRRRLATTYGERAGLDFVRTERDARAVVTLPFEPLP